MKYVKKYSLFLESVDVAPAPVKKQTERKLKHGGPKATVEDVFSRLVRVAEDKNIDLEKLIKK